MGRGPGSACTVPASVRVKAQRPDMPGCGRLPCILLQKPLCRGLPMRGGLAGAPKAVPDPLPFLPHPARPLYSRRAVLICRVPARRRPGVFNQGVSPCRSCSSTAVPIPRAARPRPWPLWPSNWKRPVSRPPRFTWATRPFAAVSPAANVPGPACASSRTIRSTNASNACVRPTVWWWARPSTMPGPMPVCAPCWTACST